MKSFISHVFHINRVHFLFGVDECDHATAGADYQLRLVLEQHLDHFVGVAEDDGFLSPLPSLDVYQFLIFTLLTCRSVLLREGELNGLEFLITVKIALEMLQKHHFLIDRLRVAEEIELRELLNHALRDLSLTILGLLL